MPRSRAILLLLLMAGTTAVVACSGQGGRDRVIRFELTGGQGIADLKFFIHDVELVDEQGRAHPFALGLKAPWQTSQIALLDLAGADKSLNAEVRGRIDSGRSYRGLRFRVGVPFELNHGNPLAAEAPLDRSEMFWAWQSGHKFLRADWQRSGVARSFHLGSTGCSSASALRPPQEPCRRPNVMRVELLGFDPLRQSVALDASALIDSLAGSEQSACTGDYAAACASAYALTGLDSEGRCPDDICRAQRLFVRPST